jgi:hypothetical protein
MGTKFFILLIPVFHLLACCKCEEDSFGNQLELVIPLLSYPQKDTFKIGDTIWFDIDIDKQIEIFNTDQTILLQDFDFLTDFFVSEISDTIENYNVSIDTIVVAGSMQKLVLQTAIVYPVKFIENDTSYRFKAGIVFHHPGLYWLGLSTSYLFFEHVDHPALYVCKNKRRERVDVYYQNNSTSKEVYDELFFSTNVEYLKELTSFEEYKNVGSITIVVEE